ncbi:MAG: MBL fold metallo-hydrolase [Planctomycetota bacterium]|nr:MAG: MBL fold metallo-hydrolase [Planctomycetota bacterium]
MNPHIRITTLVENTASDPQLLTEHGLSFWIEYADKRVLFDTGQSDMLIRNAKTLGINLAEANAIVLSHGHYDHTGGLAVVLDIAAKAKLYLHLAAIGPKFSRKGLKERSICMPDSAKKAIRDREVIWTKTPTKIFHGVTVTSQVPRVNKFEDVGGAFFLDQNGRKPDGLLDDQALFIESPKGLIIVLGCAHAGVVNTLHRIADLSRRKNFYAVMGGMHLLHASKERIERTQTVFREYNLQKIGPAHCTGGKAVEKFKKAFPSQCFVCSVGTRIDL